MKGSGISFEGAQNLVAKNNAVVKWNDYHQTFSATFKDQQTETNYEIWFNNVESLKKKISLVKEYNLKGWGAWWLGQEDQGIWEILSQPQSIEDSTGILGKRIIEE